MVNFHFSLNSTMRSSYDTDYFWILMVSCHSFALSACKYLVSYYGIAWSFCAPPVSLARQWSISFVDWDRQELLYRCMPTLPEPPFQISRACLLLLLLVLPTHAKQHSDRTLLCQIFRICFSVCSAYCMLFWIGEKKRSFPLFLRSNDIQIHSFTSSALFLKK